MNTAPVCDLHELESIQLNTISENGKRLYTDDAGEIKYPSVTTVTGLLNREHIKLWRERVGAEEANKITKKATTRGTKFHQHVEDLKSMIDNSFSHNPTQSTRPAILSSLEYRGASRAIGIISSSTGCTALNIPSCSTFSKIISSFSLRK